MRNLLAFLGAGLLAVACAGPDVVARESPSEREYPTGSNIPKKPAQRDQAMEGVSTMTRNTLEQIQNTGNGSPGRASGLTP